MPATDIDGARVLLRPADRRARGERDPRRRTASPCRPACRSHQPGQTSSATCSPPRRPASTVRAPLGGGRSEVRIDDGSSVDAERDAGRGRQRARRARCSRATAYSGEQLESVVELSRQVAKQLGMEQPRRSRPSPPPRSCTTSARSAMPDRILDKPGAARRRRVGPDARAPDRSASGSCKRSPAWAPSRRSCATSTSTGTAPATRTT